MAASKLVGPEHLAKINAALTQIDEAMREADLAKRAGYDIQSQIDELNKVKGQLLQIRNVYFPGNVA